LVAVAALGAFLGSQLAAGGSTGSSGHPISTAGGSPHAGSSGENGAQAIRIEKALERGVFDAASLGGSIEAAAIADGWSQPVVVASPPAAASRYMRMWSMSKVATMVALLGKLGWAEKPGEAISPELSEAFSGAITRSENCHQRRVVLELERASRGTAEARAAMEEVFRESGGSARIGTQAEAPESICLPYLETQAEIPDPLAPALLLGTSTWRVSDAVLLVHALATNRFGAAVSKRVLDLMRAPKLPSREVPPGELTAPLDWGAGRVFAARQPAYKAGWGGALNGNFLAGEICLVDLPGVGQVALAAAFHPDVQPSRDDPGITDAPRAIELVFGAVAGA
jgi:hypothetical protein